MRWDGTSGGRTRLPLPGCNRWRNRGLYALAAVVVGAALVFGVVRLAGGSGGTNSWTSASGRDAKAGFLGGCNQSAGAIVDCNCAFARLTATLPTTPHAASRLSLDPSPSSNAPTTLRFFRPCTSPPSPAVASELRPRASP